MNDHDIVALSPDDVQTLENVLEDTSVSTYTRRSILQYAAVGAAAVGAMGPAGRAFAATGGDTIADVINTAITAEELAITYLTGLIENVSANPVGKFKEVLKAANAAEVDHYKALKGLGAKPLTSKFWAPDAIFKPENVFPTLEVVEALFVNAYLIGTTVFANAGKADFARYAGEILGVEAQHRTLARFAQNKLPNNLGFEQYTIMNVSGIVGALEKAGIGFGKQGTTPGKFYEFALPPASALVTLKNNSPM